MRENGALSESRISKAGAFSEGSRAKIDELRKRGPGTGGALRELGFGKVRASEQQARGTADAVREQVGLKPLELLGFVAEAGYRASMYEAQIIAVATHPRVVEKTVDMALNDPDSRVRLAAQTVLHKATGFLPTPKGSQTTIAIMQNAQANATARSIVAAPRPEETIRRLENRFNEARGLPRPPAAALPGTAGRDTLPARVLHKDTEPMPFEVPGEEEDDDK